MPVEFLPDNQLTLLNSGGDYFPALISAIEDARQEVHLETYIFEDDLTGRAVARALAAAAQRGVTVRLLIDGFGAPSFTKTLMPELTRAGVMVLIYRPDLARYKLRRHRLRRLHRKLAVIDGKIAFVGGINIIDDLNTPDPSPPRYDYAVRVEGPLLRPIRKSVYRLWEVVSWAHLKRRYRLTNRTIQETAPCGKQTAAFLVRDNFRHRHEIEKAYLKAIGNARESILIANAYFLPGRRFLRALRTAARRGVTVTLLLQGRIEYRLLHYATQALYGQLLGHGIHIFEYHRSLLHAKVAVIDGQWATVGSSNIDPFSLLLAQEANLVAQDKTFALALRQSLETALREGATELPQERWHQLPWPSRLVRWLSYTLIRMAIGLSGYGNKI